MKRPKRRTAVIAAAVTIAGCGVAGAAAASAGPPSGTAETTGEHQDPSYTGSVRAPAASGSNGEGADQSGDQSALQGLPTVSVDQARAAALAAVPGSVQAADLSDENGFVVYSVEVAGADGTVTDVKVDAGTGKVLARDSGEAQSGDGTETGTETGGETESTTG
jgi:uncharacterized membrane protein YkoI